MPTDDGAGPAPGACAEDAGGIVRDAAVAPQGDAGGRADADAAGPGSGPHDDPDGGAVPRGGIARRDFIAGVEKGFAILEAFDAAETARMTMAEVAQRTGLTRAAARRYLLTLAALGYLHYDGRMFALTPKVLRLGQSYIHSARLPRIVHPQLHRIASALQEASSVGVLDGGDIICVAAVTAGRVVSVTLQPGTRVPAHCTANGRVLLAALPPAALDDWLAAREFAPFTAHTVTARDRLRAEIVQARTQGYALVDQELEPGLRAIGVPLRNLRGETVAAMNVNVHAARMSLEEVRSQCLPLLWQAQAQVRNLL
jgi:IclR family pca regulon transcriptional regulator